MKASGPGLFFLGRFPLHFGEIGLPGFLFQWFFISALLLCHPVAMWPPPFLMGSAFKTQPAILQLCLLFLLGKPWKSARVGSLKPSLVLPLQPHRPEHVYGLLYSLEDVTAFQFSYCPLFLVPCLLNCFPPKILVNSFCFPFLLHIVPGNMDSCSN